MLIIGINYDQCFSWSTEYDVDSPLSASEQLAAYNDNGLPDEIIFVGVENVEYVACVQVTVN